MYLLPPGKTMADIRRMDEELLASEGVSLPAMYGNRKTHPRLTVAALRFQLHDLDPDWTVHAYEGEDCVISVKDAEGKERRRWSCEPA